MENTYITEQYIRYTANEIAAGEMDIQGVSDEALEDKIFHTLIERAAEWVYSEDENSYEDILKEFF